MKEPPASQERQEDPTSLVTLEHAYAAKFPSRFSVLLDEWRFSLLGLLLALIAVSLEAMTVVEIGKHAGSVFSGMLALWGLALAATLVSVPAVIEAEFPKAIDAATSKANIVATAWLNARWIFWVTVAALFLTIASFKWAVVGASLPGLALVALLRTQLVVTESMRLYLLLATSSSPTKRPEDEA